MERFVKYKELQDVWTYDYIALGNLVGSVRDPFVIKTEAGTELVPASIVYLKSPNGNRKSTIVNGAFNKVLYEHSRASDYLKDSVVNSHIVVDEDAQAAILALPISGDIQIFPSSESLDVLRATNTPQAEVVKRFTDKFSDIKFGIFGSQALFMSGPTSDIDLFVLGCKQFTSFHQTLQEEEIQKELELEPLSADEKEFNAIRFANKFQVSVKQARRISELRCRFKVRIGDEYRSLSFSAALDPSEIRNLGTLGTKKIGKVKEHGTIVNADYSSGFPRIYQVEIEGKIIDVVSMHWSFRALAYQSRK